MNKWFQDGTPTSYKIQLGYLDIPQHLIKTNFVDTPYRFSSFEDANNIAADMFPNVQFRIVGSSDEPHWSAPTATVKADKLKSEKWYDVYGVRPKYHDGFSVVPGPNPDPEVQKTMDALAKLRHPLKYQLVAKPQGAQTAQRKQAGQTGQGRQQSK